MLKIEYNLYHCYSMEYSNQLSSHNTLDEALAFNNNKLTSVADSDKKIDRVFIIEYLRRRYSYHSYLEIGCRDDDCFANNNFEYRVGVDPVSGGTHRMTSDEFFEQNDQYFDLIFIDGLHWSEQVIRDIDNSLKYLSEDGTIVMHDCLPINEDSAVYPMIDGIEFWNGDVWKGIIHAKKNPDIKTSVLRVDWGLGIIQRGRNHLHTYAKSIKISRLQWRDYLHYRDNLFNVVDMNKLFDWLN
jgi:Methyltransferase domain